MAEQGLLCELRNPHRRKLASQLATDRRDALFGAIVLYNDFERQFCRHREAGFMSATNL
jgi:hypothetical protein